MYGATLEKEYSAVDSNAKILEGNWVYGKPKGLFKYTDTFGKTFERKL